MKNGEPRVRFIPILLNIGYNVINQCHHVPGHKYFMSITHLLDFEMERMEKNQRFVDALNLRLVIYEFCMNSQLKL